MKKILLLLLFLVLFKNVKTQVVFCPPGAEWHYSRFVWLPGIYYNSKIKYTQDSIVGTDTLKVLLHDVYYYYCNGGPGPEGALTFIKQKGDTVFMKSLATKNTWQILYNYAATAGQSWTTIVSSFYNPSVALTYTITVDSVNYITVNGFILKNLFVKYKKSGTTVSMNAQITERFGCNLFVFAYYNPILVSDCDYISSFLCYGDDQFGLKQFTDKNCTYVDAVGISENKYQNSDIKISPNPANDFFTISSENEMLSGGSIVSINDLTGRTLKQIYLSGLNSEKINVSSFANGIYILNITNDNTSVYTGKLVKKE